MGARSLLALVLAATALALPTASTAHRSDLTACELISTGKLAAILGVEHVKIVKNLPGTSAADNTSGVTHSVCNGLAWSGIAPTTRSAALLALANGRAAAFALDVWAPDDASTFVDRWKSQGFDALVAGATTGVITLPGLPAFKPYHLRRLLPVGGKAGVDGAVGISGTPRGVTGVRAASGSWWSYPSAAIVSIAFVGSARNPTVKQLNEIAKVVVSAFGLAPLTLR
jgi:hypothetical protein